MSVLQAGSWVRLGRNWRHPSTWSTESEIWPALTRSPARRVQELCESRSGRKFRAVVYDTLPPTAAIINYDTLPPTAAIINYDTLPPTAAIINYDTLPPTAAIINYDTLPPTAAIINYDTLPPTAAIINYAIGLEFFFLLTDSFTLCSNDNKFVTDNSNKAVKCCLMPSDVSWHIRDKLWPMPKHGSIILYVHGNQKAR